MMRKTLVLIVVMLLLVLSAGLSSAVVVAQETEVYLWEQFVPTGLDRGQVDAEIQLLQSEVEQILARSALAPLRMNYGDLAHEGYWIYRERGRVITTLAAAYPYLTEDQQAQVQRYVQTMLQAGDEAPWDAPLKDKGEGEERRLHGYAITDGRYPHFPDPGPTPTLHVIYGLWLYGERADDWDTLRVYWDDLKQFYDSQKNEAILYGQLSGFVGMARLAHQFDDAAMLSTVEADARSQFADALDPSVIVTRQRNSTYGFFMIERNEYFFPGQPWMFLEMSPEIARYIRDHDSIRSEAITRMTQFQEFYPYWWLHQAPYFTRWTGDEGIGLTPETFGMLIPLERWINGTAPADLQNYMRSAPVGVGDLYWIEALVTVIESVAQPCWQDIRVAETMCSA